MSTRIRPFLLAYIFFLTGLPVGAQSFPEPIPGKGPTAGLFFSNVGVNGLVGGLGSVINKKPGQQGGKVFLKGFAQGCLGGAIQFGGKSLTYQINRHDNLGWIWPARLVNAAGSSITMNAASNRNFWEAWRVNLWFLRMDYDLTTRKFRTRVSTTGIYATLHVGVGNTLKLGPTLATGTFVFEGSQGWVSSGGNRYTGIGYATAIGYPPEWEQEGTYYEWMAHEFAHILQYDNFSFINSYFDKANTRWIENSKGYKGLSKYVYFDLGGPLFYLTYLAESNQPWEHRTFERGADRFGRHVAWPKRK